MQTSNTIPANPAVFALGPPHLRSTLVHLCKAYPTLPLVSIGSGSAMIERSIRHLVKNEFIMVDPAPNSYYNMCDFEGHVKKLGILPDYAYTKDLIRQRPELTIGRACLVYLNWCNPGDDDYDLEAIRLLKPRAFVTVIDTNECAGSKQFHTFLKDTNVYQPLLSFSVIDPCKEKYPCAHTTIAMKVMVDFDGRLPNDKEIVVCGHDHSEANTRNIELLL